MLGLGNFNFSESGLSGQSSFAAYDNNGYLDMGATQLDVFTTMQNMNAVISAPHSVGFWMRAKDGQPPPQMIVFGADTTSGNYYKILLMNQLGQAGKLHMQFMANNDVHGVKTVSSTIFPNGQDTWKHVMVTWTHGETIVNCKIYIDGTEVSTTQAGKTCTVANAEQYSGGFVSVGALSGYDCMNGLLDEVVVYSKALSDEEVAAHIDHLNKPVDALTLDTQPYLVNYYKFDSTTAQTFQANSGSSNTAGAYSHASIVGSTAASLPELGQ